MLKRRKLMTDKLTDKQKRFCEEYLIDFNATQAAIRAGYSKTSAYAIGHENLKKHDIQNTIQILNKKVSDRLEITQERIKKEYARLAFLDVREMFNENGALKEIHDLDDDTAAAIGGMEIVAESSLGGDKVFDTVKKIKIIDKKGALDSLAKIEGMFTDKVDVTNETKIIRDNIPDTK
jgi:phage terminase small subunit